MGVAAKVSRLWRDRGILRTLVIRDLRVRYARSWLGYFWTVLDPLAMAAIYFLVFVYVFQRGDVGHDPYFIFLVIGLLSWQWFSGSTTESAKALLNEAKLIRSTNLPREIWVMRIVIAKTIEYLLSLPVLVGFAIVYLIRGELELNARLLLFPFGVLLQLVLLTGIGLILAPVTALVTDMQRVIRILLRMGFYFTPVIYAIQKVPEPYDRLMWFNPVASVLEIQRAGFFDEPLKIEPVIVGVCLTLVILAIGIWTFGRLERAVLKEI